MKKLDSAHNCGPQPDDEQYSNSNPGSIYIQFVLPQLERADIVRMMTTHANNLKAERRAAVLQAQAAKLREEEDGEGSADEVEAMSATLKRRKESARNDFGVRAAVARAHDTALACRAACAIGHGRRTRHPDSGSRATLRSRAPK